MRLLALVTARNRPGDLRQRRQINFNDFLIGKLIKKTFALFVVSLLSAIQIKSAISNCGLYTDPSKKSFLC